ncbi:protein-glutamine gamma-glutamyltransferase E-like [Crotalus tigris]|uniref:protein-glutamine gamma-glutamyltransferase E-like n=1 Tax=Crotalus tigris TaxID=88082 RepID=UPI00192F169F|nr:protein-glutamine gamma-glutamyltransferase E-like [Crotalus tigris]
MAASSNIDWRRSENAQEHHTNSYPGDELVVRRGWGFKVRVKSPPPATGLIFSVDRGSTTALQAKTRVDFGVSGTASRGSWSAVETSGSYSISSPANAAIGRYRLGIKTGSGVSVLGTFVVLFNPWLTEDEVFMPDNAQHQEYVLSEFGVLFAGSANRISQFGWNFGQFQDEILDISLLLMDRSLSYRKDPTADLRRRNDPKYVGRVLSAMVNSNDDYGVLQGRWDGNYAGGESPTSWTGSVDILRRWKSSGFRPVRYGQCWVFAGVLNTILRCLGIPSRPITNFNSAHDTDMTLTIDVYYDLQGNPLNIASDSVWNFHVWNEGWFARSDLGATYNGWQILDATPQERSSGIFQCGPTSLTAIKEGDVDLVYDCPFVFSEVNADRFTWAYDRSTGEKKLIYSETQSIGQNTSTKRVGSYARQDVTGNYKYPEGSAKEREIFRKARGKLNLDMLSATAMLPEAEKQISGKFKLEGIPEVGKDVSLVLQLTNLASEQKKLTANMSAWSIVYTGKLIRKVWKNSLKVDLGPKEEKAFPIKISYAEYEQHLTADNMLRATALCQLEEGHDTVVERDITLDNPSITIKVLDQAKVGQVTKVEASFTNPLDEELRDCILQVEGSDLLAEKLKLQVPPLKAQQSSQMHFEISPSKDGTKQLLVNFSCDKFQDIKAFETLTVAPN